MPGAGATVLGRDKPPFVGDKQVSRRHAELTRASGTLTLSDLGSTNGSWLNGLPLDGQPRPLRPDDVVTIGDTQLVVRQLPVVRAPDAPIDGLLGRSDGIRRLRSGIKRFARAAAPVRITGETGAGKELVATALATMGRPQRPWLAFNAAATSPHLVDAALFGHVKGAFTGADRARKGLFETAHTGTLFLDEVGELSPEVQVKLLRVLQESEVTPVGAVEPVRVDVRLVTATNRDRIAEVREGRFCSDLYARLAKLTIHVPPLRERQEDVPLLALALAERFAGRSVTFTTEALTRLLLHRWPLNVRELDGIVTQAVVEADGDGPIGLSGDLVRRMQEHASLAVAPTDHPLDKAMVEGALRRSGGNMKQAAEALGKDRGQFYRIVKKLGLDPGDYRV